MTTTDTFSNLYSLIKSWIISNQAKWLKQNICADITKDYGDILLIDFTFTHCIGQIVVEQNAFAPYKYVSCEALSLNSTKTDLYGSELIYFYYDSENTKIEETLHELELMLVYCQKYTPNCLWNEYINKNGRIASAKAYPEAVHPDDWEVFEKIDITHTNFSCVDTFAQYLVLKNGDTLIRVKDYAYTSVSP